MDVTSSLRSLLPYGRRSIGISQLVSKLEGYLPPDEVELVQEAYDFAFQAHQGQRRRSGEPYITHPVAVADLLEDGNRLGNLACNAISLRECIERIQREWMVQSKLGQMFFAHLLKQAKRLRHSAGGAIGKGQVEHRRNRFGMIGAEPGSLQLGSGVH